MKCLIVALFGLTALCAVVSCGDLGGSTTVVKLEPTSNGFWKKKIIWKPRWVKSWQEKKIYVAHWKKTWGPVQLKEWVPIPKPPPGWIKPIHKPVAHVHHHHKVAVAAPVRTYAPAHVDYIHRQPVYHPHKTVSLVNPDTLHFHAAHDSHYGPAYHHSDFIANHAQHHHHDGHQLHHPHDNLPHHHHHHEEIINPNAETFAPQFLQLSLEHLKI